MPADWFWPLATYGCLGYLVFGPYRDTLLRYACHRAGLCNCSGGWRFCSREWRSR